MDDGQCIIRHLYLPWTSNYLQTKDYYEPRNQNNINSEFLLLIIQHKDAYGHKI